MDNGINHGYEKLTNMLDSNKKQLLAMTDVAKNILRKIDGAKNELCSENSKESELPGILKQTNDNIIITEDLYSLILEIDSRI